MSEYALLGFKSEVNIQGLYLLHQFWLVLLLFCLILVSFYGLNQNMTILEFIM